MKKIAKIILYKNNQVLLQLRDNKPNIPYPNTWSLFGGLIDKNESAKQTIKREIKEELNYDLKNIKLIHQSQRKENDLIVEDNVFAAEIDCNLSNLKLTEGQKMKFFSINDLNKIKIMPK